MHSSSRTLALRRSIKLVVLLCALVLPASAQNLNVAGEWMVELTLPLGDQTFTMLIEQKDNVLSGHTVNEFGQSDLTGSISRDQIKLQWSFVDGGAVIPVTFNGKATRYDMSGSAKVGTIGEGPVEAHRK